MGTTCDCFSGLTRAASDIPSAFREDDIELILTPRTLRLPPANTVEEPVTRSRSGNRLARDPLIRYLTMNP